LQKNTGNQKTIFKNLVLWKGKRDLSKPSRFSYCPAKECKDSPLLPLIPWTINPNVNGKGSANFTMVVAEVGKPSKSLEFFLEVFKKNKSDLGKLLKEAIENFLSN